MKLAILGSRGIPARYGGFETFAEELSVRLAQQGVDVTVYCEAGEVEGVETFQGVHLVHIPAPRFGPLTTIIFDLLCLWHARKSFDVVYMLGYGASIFCFIPRIWGSTVWINMDGVEWARTKWGGMAKLWFKIMEAAAMWTPTRVIADAKGIRLHLESRHDHLPAVSVIPYGAPIIKAVPDAGLLDEWKLNPGGYYLIVCRLEPENSVKELVLGYLLSESAYPLIVIGSIDRKTDYVRDLLMLNSDRVRFVGSVYDKEKLQALRYHSFAYFHGHTVGGTNPSLLEAMGCGNLIVAHDNMYNREVAGESAIYFNGAEDLAENLRSVNSFTQEVLLHLRVLAQDRIEKKYNWALIVDTYYETLLSGQKETSLVETFPIPDLNTSLTNLFSRYESQVEKGGRQKLARNQDGSISMKRVTREGYRKEFQEEARHAFRG